MRLFDGGQAFHAIYGKIYTSAGSQGCVNVNPGNANKLWCVLKTNDKVYAWGRRPGT